MISPEELRKHLDEARAALEQAELEKKDRGWRNRADPLALDYEDYRKTKLWKQIKTRVLARDNHVCRRCSGRADLVHHMSYDEAVMLGNDDSKLVSLCSGCHDIVHFTSTGEKRNADEQLAALSDSSLDEPLPKVDLRRIPFKLPNWRRFTDLQKRAYLSEHNAKKRISLSRLARGQSS